MSGSVCLEKNLNIILGLSELVGVWWLSWLGGINAFTPLLVAKALSSPPLEICIFPSIHAEASVIVLVLQLLQT